MAELKTKQTKASVADFLNGIKDATQRKDSLAISKLMQAATKSKPKMWGPSIVGFGTRLVRYASGRELEWMRIGFSPRKGNLSLYLSCGGFEQFGDTMKKLGKYKTGLGCLYIKKLEDVDSRVLKQLIAKALK